jgi:hypothetical protein
MAKVGELKLPGRPILMALGRIALHHGHLTYVLRLTLKDTGHEKFDDAMSATKRTKWWELLKAVQGLIEQKASRDDSFDTLKALLTRADAATKKRNDLIHKLWAEYNGRIIVRGDQGVERRPAMLGEPVMGGCPTKVEQIDSGGKLRTR